MTAPIDRPSSTQKRAPPLEIGARVADKYKIESLVGEGGMGFVFAATHEQLGHRVAIKVLPSSFLSDKDVTERFLREGRALARLQGEHIARVSDVGTLPTGEPYLVMEFLEGRDLAKELADRGPLPLVETVEFLAQACEALAEAHARGIVHRDLKPANLFLTHKIDGDPCVKVLDFGIARLAPADGAAAENDNITVTSTIVGTPKYMSPEQIQDSRSVDQRTDIWGLGTIFYELLTQNRPFAAPSLALVCVKVLQEEVPAPSTIRRDLPPEVDAVIARCLKKDPANRFATVGELVEALVPIGGPNVRASATRVTRILVARAGKSSPDSSNSVPGISSVGLTRTPSAQRLENKDGATLAAATLLETTGKKKKTSRWLALLAVVPVVAVVLFFALRSNKPEHPVTAAAPPPPTPSAVAPSAQPSAAPPPTASEATVVASASAAPAVHHVPAIHHVHTAPHPTGTAPPQGTGDNVLEDRR
ncbi:MAG TPA: serine/threonine-protein kinase [Polyangiaceae bacterium]